MPPISEKGKQMPSSPIRKLVPFAEEARQKGRIIYHLNIGQPDIHTAPLAMKAVHASHPKVIEYSHSAGNESYRKKLAAWYNRWNYNITPENIMITTGGSEALTFTLMSCFNPGEEIIIPEPFYANYNSFAVAAGVKVVPVTSSFENNFALPAPSDIEKKISPKTRGILISNPNNPTGYLYSFEEMQQLKAIVKKYDLYLISDEVYREFCYDAVPFHSVMELKGVDENVILIDSVSKRYSACGLRIGALVTRNRMVIETAMKFAMARLSPPSLGQIAAEAMIDTPESYFKEVYHEYLERRNYIVNALNEIPGVKCLMPKGAFYTIARLPIDDCDAFCQWLLSDFEYHNQTVMLAPATGFYATPGLGKEEVRVAYVLKKEDLKKAVECLREALKIYPGRK